MRNRFPLAAAALVAAGLAAACASEEARFEPFTTSGSRDADQRAEQRVVRTQQLRGVEASSRDSLSEEEARRRLTLYERLGGERGLDLIVDDFVDRALADPRVNWERRGVKSGGVLGIGGKSAQWAATPESVGRLKAHMRQFLAVATGGPTRYDGRDMREVHAGLGITNSEFDAAIGDLKATLDALRVADAEQKELLAVLESSRPQIAEER